MQMQQFRRVIMSLGIIFGLAGICAVSRLLAFQWTSSYVDWEWEQKMRSVTILLSEVSGIIALLGITLSLFKQKDSSRDFVCSSKPDFVALCLAVSCYLALFAEPNLRSHPRGSPINFCIAQLRAIDGAKQVWALEHKMPSTAVPKEAEIIPYLGKEFSKKSLPRCPLGGVYTIGPVSDAPTCSIEGHRLPDQ